MAWWGKKRTASIYNLVLCELSVACFVRVVRLSASTRQWRTRSSQCERVVTKAIRRAEFVRLSTRPRQRRRRTNANVLSRCHEGYSECGVVRLQTMTRRRTLDTKGYSRSGTILVLAASAKQPTPDATFMQKWLFAKWNVPVSARQAFIFRSLLKKKVIRKAARASVRMASVLHVLVGPTDNRLSSRQARPWSSPRLTSYGTPKPTHLEGILRGW